jgi:hypothetical protein
VAPPTTADLSDFVGHAVTAEQGNAVLSVVTALASAYTRGEGIHGRGTERRRRSGRDPHRECAAAERSVSGHR